MGARGVGKAAKGLIAKTCATAVASLSRTMMQRHRQRLGRETYGVRYAAWRGAVRGAATT